MADGHFPTLVSATRDANATANPLFAQLTDGADLATITAGGSLNVNVTNASIVVTATDLDIRDLTHVSDSVKVGDGTDFLAIAADGSIAVTDNGGSLTVDGTVAVSSVIPGTGATNLGKAEDSAHTSGDVGVLGLSVRRDANTTLVDTDGDYAPLQVDASGALKVNVTTGATNIQYAEDSAHVSGDIGTAALVVRKDTIGTNTSADGDYATLLQDANGRLYVQIHDGGNSITVDGTVTVTATDLDIRDLTLAQDAVKISANTTANSEINPIFVQVVSDVITSTEVHSYNTASAIAADATSNHDYTVTGTTFLLKQVKFAVSGGGKVEIQTGPVASLVTTAVGFIPKEGGIVQIDFDPPKEVPVTSTGTVRVIRTNRQGAAQDVYSTIIGNDIP